MVSFLDTRSLALSLWQYSLFSYFHVKPKTNWWEREGEEKKEWVIKRVFKMWVRYLQESLPYGERERDMEFLVGKAWLLVTPHLCTVGAGTGTKKNDTRTTTYLTFRLFGNWGKQFYIKNLRPSVLVLLNNKMFSQFPANRSCFSAFSGLTSVD